MTLRLSSNGLRIRLSSDEARRLLEEENVEEDFHVFPTELYRCSLRLGNAEFTAKGNGFLCRIDRERLLAAVTTPSKRAPIERIFPRAGYEVSVEIDAFDRG